MRPVLCVLFAIAWSVHAQSIFTIAGGGTPDGRPAVATPFTVGSMAFDSRGRLYFSDGTRVKRINSNGLLETVAGNGAQAFAGDGGNALLAAFSGGAIAFDGNDNLYIADDYNGRIRRVDAKTGIITTIGGGGDHTIHFGDGLPATAVSLDTLLDIMIDHDGTVIMVQANAVRRIASDGRIETIAGSPSLYFDTHGFRGDGGPAADSLLDRPSSVAADADDNLFIADGGNNRIRRIDAVTHTITTYAGNGIAEDLGDGGSAITASLDYPSRIAFDSHGNLLVANVLGHLRRIDSGTHTIDTVTVRDPAGARLEVRGVSCASGLTYVTDQARIFTFSTNPAETSHIGGNGSFIFNGDGGPATAAELSQPAAVTQDAAGNLFVATLLGIRRLDALTSLISTVPGTDSGDILSTQNLLFCGGSLYAGVITTLFSIDPDSGVLMLVAGTGASGYSGDNGPATRATFRYISGLGADDQCNLYVADLESSVVRRIDGHTGIITTVAGTGTYGYNGDAGPATQIMLTTPSGVVVDDAGNLYIADSSNFRVVKVLAADGQLTTLTKFQGYPIGLTTAGGRLYATVTSSVLTIDTISGAASTYACGPTGFGGDGGPATQALVDLGEGGGLGLGTEIHATPAGDLYIADVRNDRVRFVPACREVSAPVLQRPASGASSELLSPKLAWSPVTGAFHYDLYLDTHNPPATAVATNLTLPTYSPANLQPLTTYYWMVLAKGDPFCVPFSSAPSAVSSFTTAGSCSVTGDFATAAPAAVAGRVQLSWTPSARAGTYDVAIGTANPPRVYANGLTATAVTIDGLASGTTYYWNVTAHAACDDSWTTSTPVQSFTTAGACSPPSAVILTAPADGDGAVSAEATLAWNAAAGASAYDVYFGTGSSPALYLADVEQTSVAIPRLSPGAEYTWKVVAKAACNPARSVESSLRRFTVAACAAPQATAIISAPGSAVAAGATYTIAWRESAGMDDAASYLVERSMDAQFSSIVDAQQTTATSASFVSSQPGTYFHRVTAIAGCDVSRRSPPSDAAKVTVAAGPPVVVFTLQPQAVITTLGQKLEDQKTRFAIENLGPAPLQVLVAPQLLGGSLPFFTIVDPFGGDPNFVTLEPRKPKTLEVHFSGPRNDQPASYQGSIYVTSVGQPLAFTPQAYVNLKVGGDTSAATPKLLVNGVESGFTFFPPATGDDAARPAINVDILNSGNVSMDVAGEIGPEAWLKLEKDWNATPIAASSFRTLRLTTQRTRAVAGSALPRYTYLTIRNKAGASARLLVEDDGGVAAAAGRTAPLGAGERSFVIPSVRSGSQGVSIVDLTNTGAAAAPLDLVWTPEGADGFDAGRVRRISIVVPPNDVVSLADPLAQLFGASGDAAGSLEILSKAEKLGALIVRSEVRTAVAGGSYGYVVPVVLRGEGARLDAPHRIAGVAASASLRTALLLAETTGRDTVEVHLTLRDSDGANRGEQTVALARYGSRRIDDVVGLLTGGGSIAGGSVDVEVTRGGGAVAAVSVVSDTTTGSGAAFVGEEIGPEIHLSTLGRRIRSTAATQGRHLTIGGAVSDGGSVTTVSMTAAADVHVTLTYRDVTGKTSVRNATLGAGRTTEFSDMPTGTVTIDADGNVVACARVRGGNTVDALPVVSVLGEALTGGGGHKPVFAEGLEQSIDGTRGRRTGLVLTETAGDAGTVTVRLYEPGDRTVPIAEKDFTIAAGDELRLPDLFAAMGLASGPDDLEQRSKDRTNVACVVTPKSGHGVIAALAVVTDNRTGERRSIQLQPAGGVPATAAQFPFAAKPRRRAVGK
jgi:sugar lactone lactonase YvrE